MLAEKPPIASQASILAGGFLNDLIRDLTTIASVYHKPSSVFLSAAAVEITKQR